MGSMGFLQSSRAGLNSRRWSQGRQAPRDSLQLTDIRISQGRETRMLVCRKSGQKLMHRVRYSRTGG